MVGSQGGFRGKVEGIATRYLHCEKLKMLEMQSNYALSCNSRFLCSTCGRYKALGTNCFFG